MTKEAIRKREYRAKLSDEKKNATKIENAERSKLWRKSGDTEAKKSKDAERKKQSRDELSGEEKVAFNSKDAARKREKRAKKKAANQQSAPENLSIGPPCHYDEMQAGSSTSANAAIAMNEELSEYEQLRQRNINERNQKFAAQFGFPNPLDQNLSTQSKKRSLPKPDSTSETLAVNPVRKQPKRKCTFQPKAMTDSESDSDKSFENYVDGLVEASLAETELYVDPNLIVKSILRSIISSVCGSKPRKSNIGRKTKNAKRMAVSRYELIFIN